MNILKGHKMRWGFWIGAKEGKAKHFHAIQPLGFYKLRENAEIKAREVFGTQTEWRVLRGAMIWKEDGT